MGTMTFVLDSHRPFICSEIPGKSANTFLGQKKTSEVLNSILSVDKKLIFKKTLKVKQEMSANEVKWLFAMAFTFFNLLAFG